MAAVERPELCPTCGRRYDPARTKYCDKCGNRFPWAGGPPAKPWTREAPPRWSGEHHPAIAAAAILFFLHAGWVVSFLVIGAYVVLNGDLPPGFGGAPHGRIYDAFGLGVAMVGYGLMAAVSMLSILAGFWLWQARRTGAVLGVITLAVGPVFWYGFGLPIPPYIAVVQLVLLAVGWKSLH